MTRRAEETPTIPRCLRLPDPPPLLRQVGAVLLLASLTALAPCLPAQAAEEAGERFDKALQLAQRQQDSQAIYLFDQLARDHPERPEPLINLGVLLARQGRLDEARAALDRALRTSPAHALAHDNLSRLATSTTELGWSPSWSPAHPPRAAADTGATSVGAMLREAFGAETDHLLRPAAIACALLAVATAAWTASRRRPRRTARAAASPRTEPPVTQAPAMPPPPPPAAAAVALPVAAPAAPAPVATPMRVARPAPPPLPVAPPAITPPIAPAPARQPPAPLPAAMNAATPDDRLIGIYRLLGQGQYTQALARTEALVRDLPRFAPAQMIYGDLLMAQTGLVRGMTRPSTLDPEAQHSASQFQAEARTRLTAWQEMPPAGTLPRQILQLAPSVRQVVAVEAACSRLFVLEQRAGHVVVTARHFASIGRLGIGRHHDGEPATPLGIYEITDRLDRRQIGNGHGAGALALSYPNEHDRRLQRAPARIWLHGPQAATTATPPSNKGCIVLANDDLQRLLHELVPRRTPVIIAERLDWVAPRSLAHLRLKAQNLVEVWRMARMKGDLAQLLHLYAQGFDNGETTRAGWQDRLDREMQASGGRDRQLADLSLFAWQDQEGALLISFREVLRGNADGPLRRQYWAREGGQWRIFSEGVLQ